MIEFIDLPSTLAEYEVRLNNWLKNLAKAHKFKIGRLVYNFVNNEEILRINKKHLEHDYFTDIITFNYVEGNKINGEIFISTEQVEEQRHDYDNNFEEELLRVIAHGLLHLVGFDDHNDEDRGIMRREEEKSLILHAQISED